MHVAGRTTFWVLSIVLVAVACSTSPTGRSQLTIFPSGEMNQMGITAFAQIREDTPTSSDAAKTRYVRCITNALLEQVEGRDRRLDWEVVLFDDDAVNAFALPGGKMGVYKGLLGVAENQHQLATVIGHEIGHVLAEHGNERMSTNFAAGAGLQVVQILAGEPTPQKQAMMGMLGLGAQFGVVLPFSRAQESEADMIGLDLMAKAGFDPRQSVNLWQNMSAASGGGGPPEFMSTHPASQTRIRNLQDRMPTAQNYYNEAQAAGRRPACG
jgi:predicted Zn-dependent protease